MKFCPNCGNQLPDDAMFCNSCGTKMDAASAPAQQAAPVQQQAPVQPQNNAPKTSSMSKNAKVGLIAIIAAVAVVAVILIIILTSIFGGPKAAIKGFMKDYQSGSFKWFWDATPKKLYAEWLDYEKNIDIKEFEEANNEANKAAWEIINKEGDFELSYDIKAIEQIDELKKLKGETQYNSLRDIKNRLKNRFEKYDFEADDLTDAYVAKVNIEFKLDGEKVLKHTGYFCVAKYDGDWYVFTDDFEPIFGLRTIYSSLRDKFPDAAKDIYEAVEDIQNEYEDIAIQ